MPTITITINVPDGATINVEESPDEGLTPEAGTLRPASDTVERYWRTYLSANGRQLYGGAADVERTDGPGYTLGDVAKRIDRKYTTAQSIHRTTGRSARKWKDDTGTEAPIQLEWMEYEWDEEEQGRRTTYRLPNGVADLIASFV